MHSQKPVDVVASLSKSCAKYGLKMGVYLSPWDRHEATYGMGKPYDDYFCAQLEELMTRYGSLYSVWFDGACGEGANGKKQVYDWDRYYEVIRKNQPEAVIAVCGPDVRWIGNEAGETRPSEWSVVPERLRDVERTASLSQQSDDDSFRQKKISSMDEDLGSREFLESEGDLCWYPAEVDVSIRPGWFYHQTEDAEVRSVGNLLDIYEKSVGGNALLLLNIPPDTHGQINDADVQRLKELGGRLRSIYSRNLFNDAKVFLQPECDSINNILIDDDSYWLGEESEAKITIELPETKELTHLVLCEQIRKSQRIEGFSIFAETNGQWSEIYQGTTVGFKKICRFDPITTKNVQIHINESRIAPTLRFVGAYFDAVQI